jgi:hypothetical protein
VESNLKGRELGYKDWIWFPENNILAFQSDVEPKLYPHGYSKFVREEIYQAALDKLAELTNQVNKLDREFPLIVLNEAKTTDKITQLEKANAELIFNRQGDAQKISGFEFEYDRLRLKNIEQSKIIAELKSTVSYYADNYNWRYRDAEKISQRINLNDIGPWTNYTGQTYQIGGAKARETLQRIALLESGSIADSTREKEKAE